MSNEVLEFEALCAVLEERGAAALIADLRESGDAESALVAEIVALAEAAWGDAFGAGELASCMVGAFAQHESWALRTLANEARRLGGPRWLEPVRSTQPSEPKPVRELVGHTNFIGGLLVLPDNRTAVSSSEDGTIRVWDLESGEQLKELRDHGTAVNYLALTPDGTRMLSAGDDNTIRVWSLADWSVQHVLRGHTGYVSKVMATADELAISVSNDQTVRVWDLRNGKPIKTFKEHHAWVYALAVSPDGAHAISASLNHTMIQWSLSHKPSKLRTILGDGNEDVHMVMGDVYLGAANNTGRGHKDAPNAMAWTADGRRFISASNDVVVWDAGDLSEVARFEDHAWPIKSIALCDNDRKLVTGEHCIKIWDLEATGDRVAAAWIGHAGAQLYSVAVSPDGKHLLSGDDKGNLKVWDLPAILAARPQAAHAERVYPMSFSPDKALLASASCDKSAIIWDVATGQPRHHLRGHEDIFTTQRGWLKGGQQVMTACRGALRIWDSATGELVRAIRPTPREGMGYDPREGFDFIAVCPTEDERWAFCGAVGLPPTRADLVTGELEWFEGFSGYNERVVLSADDQRALTMSYYSSYTGDSGVEKPGLDQRMCPAQEWDIASLSLRHNYFPEVSTAQGTDDTDYACQVAYSADEELVFACSSQGMFRVWDRETGELLREHALDPKSYASALWKNERDEPVVLIIDEGEAYLHRYDVGGQTLLERLVLPLQHIRNNAHSADGRWLAFTQHKRQVTLYDVAEREVVCRALVHSDISELELSEDGSLLAVGDVLGQVHIFRVRG